MINAVLLVAAMANWVGTWAASPQHWMPGRLQNYRNQTLRLIAHTSAGGSNARVTISNVYGDQPLVIGAAHIAHRTSGADIDAASDRALTFGGHASVTIAPHATTVSDRVDLDVAPLSDLAISLFFPQTTMATTTHVLGKQTNYISAPDSGDLTSAAKFAVGKTTASWPFITGVDVMAPVGAIVAFGSSITDGDGSTPDANKRWPDVLAARLQQCADANARLSVLNEGIIGNRLLFDSHSPRQSGGPFSPVMEDLGPALGDAGVSRYDRDVLSQPGVKFVILGLGINDILFPGSFIAASEAVTAEQVIEGNRVLAARAHQKGIRVIGSTISGFEGAVFESPHMDLSSPEKETVRQKVNAWIRTTRDFDGIIDFDEVLRDPARPAQLLPTYASDDHLHPNDAGYVASANAIPLTLFGCR